MGVFLLNSNFATAQGYIEGGYKTGIFLNTAGLNSTIADYNTGHQWLTEEMPSVRGAHGYRFSFGYQGSQDSPFGVYFVIQALRAEPTGSGINPYTGVLSYERLSVHYGGFGIGPMFTVVHSEVLDVQIGMDLNAFNYYVLRYQKSATPDFKFLDYEDLEVINNVNPTINLFMRFALFLGPVGIALTPEIDIPIYGKNELSQLAYIWQNTVSEPDAKMRGYNISLNATVIICPKHLSDS